MFIQGEDGKKILPSVFRSMGLVGVVLSDKVIQHFVPNYSCHRAEYSIEAEFPAYLTFNKKTRKTCFILTCPQIGSSLVRPDITKYEIKFWTRVTHLFVSVFLKITGAKYRQECFPDFKTVKESVLSILNTKKGASDHMELLHKSGQLSNVVIFKAPRQIGGEIGGRNTHATDPGKTAGSHFIEKKNRDSIPTVDRGRMGGKASHATDPGKAAGSHFIQKKNRDSIPTVDRCRMAGRMGSKASNATDPGKSDGSHFIEKENHDSMPTVDRCRKAGKANLGKPKSGSTDFFVTEEVNPVDKTPLSEKGSRFAKTKRKAAAQLVHEGAMPSFLSCAVYMSSWIKEANVSESKTIFIKGKKNAKKRLWKLTIVVEEPEDITTVDDEMYNDMSAQVRKLATNVND
jgi:hypothetical protein